MKPICLNCEHSISVKLAAPKTGRVRLCRLGAAGGEGWEVVGLELVPLGTRKDTCEEKVEVNNADAEHGATA